MAITVTQQRSATASAGALSGGRALPACFGMPRRRGIRASEQVFFFTQLSLMLEIGTPLTGSLKALAEQNRNPVFRAVLMAMLRDVEEGRQFSEAMLRHPGIFSGMAVSLVKAGETGGFLKDTLESIATMQERRQVLIAQLRSTLTYPAILCLMAVGVVGFVLIGIIPKFMVLFAGREAILPPATRLLMALSVWLRGYWWLGLPAGAGLVFAGAAAFRSAAGRAWWDGFIVRAPLVARPFNKILTCQLLRTLGHLLASHVPLLEALDVTQSTFSNAPFCAFVGQIREHVRQGGRLAQVFARNPYVMETVKQMVATGEEVGDLSRVMLRLAKFYDAEIERELKVLGSLIEPAALVVLGAVVGLIVSAVILPIFRIAGMAAQ